MLALARYAEANVAMRATLAEVLSPQDYDAVVRAETAAGAWATLRKTNYAALLPEGVPEQPESIERSVRAASGARFARAIRRLHGRAAAVGELLLSRWDLDALEFVLRLWRGKALATDERPITFVHALPFEAIRDAPTLDDIVVALRGTPYAGPLRAVAQDAAFFHAEIALERDYYGRLLAAARALGGADARAAAAFVGAELDVLNLSWLGRMLQVGALSADALRESLIVGTSPILGTSPQTPFKGGLSRESFGVGALMRRLMDEKRDADAFRDLLQTEIARLLPVSNSQESMVRQLAMLDQIVREMAIASARHALGAFPFRISTVFALYILCRTESRNLCAIFAGKAAGMGERDIASHLCGAR